MTIERNSSHCVQEMRRSCGPGLEGIRGHWVSMPYGDFGVPSGQMASPWDLH